MIKSFKIENLTFLYKNNLVLKNINYDFKINEITVILGLNGSGKTTLLKIICNILRNYTGDITIDDKLVKKMSNFELSKLISFVPQLIEDNNDFTVIDYLSFGLVNSIKFYSKPKEQHLQKIKELAEELSISKLLDKPLNQISGGERQMVQICAALIQDTPIIILDEPVSALDINNQNIILKLLKALKDKGKTIILTSHNPNICLYLDSEVILLKNNEIFKAGSAKEIININNLTPIYGDNIISSKDKSYDEITFK